ncbi:MAG: hypothetical protein HC839_01355 [Leptolyngbyaceae cyanobacterium RM2_2_21]|nr:hypothetical protein [Leptolyngbyaceae cyanobacterium RM2_2_21]
MYSIWPDGSAAKCLAFSGLHIEAMQLLYADLGVINFPVGNTNTGGQMGGWFKAEVASLADL